MRKWLYVVGPGLMLAVFLFFYFASKAETEARERTEKIEAARQRAEADEKKHQAEAKARDDAERRNAERLAAEAKAEKDKQQRYDSDMSRIKDDTDRSTALTESNATQVSELTVELDSLHKQKDSLSREGFEIQKKVELAQVARENAELDIQRMVQIIANKADESTLTKMPPPPAPSKDNS